MNRIITWTLLALGTSCTSAGYRKSTDRPLAATPAPRHELPPPAAIDFPIAVDGMSLTFTRMRGAEELEYCLIQDLALVQEASRSVILLAGLFTGPTALQRLEKLRSRALGKTGLVPLKAGGPLASIKKVEVAELEWMSKPGAPRRFVLTLKEEIPAKEEVEVRWVGPAALLPMTVGRILKGKVQVDDQDVWPAVKLENGAWLIRKRSYGVQRYRIQGLSPGFYRLGLTFVPDPESKYYQTVEIDD